MGHMSDMMGGQQYVCTQCEKIFKRKRNFSRHVKKCCFINQDEAEKLSELSVTSVSSSVTPLVNEGQDTVSTREPVLCMDVPEIYSRAVVVLTRLSETVYSMYAENVGPSSSPSKSLITVNEKDVDR